MRATKNSGIQWLGSIPYNWSIKRLKNIKSSINNAIVDGPFGSAISVNDYVDEGVPLIRIVNLGDKCVSNDKLVYIKPEHAKTLERSRVHIDDIIVAKTGATIGKCAINKGIEYGILSSSCIKISIDDKKADLDYCYYYFCSDCFMEEIKDACNGSTRDTINLTPFNNIKIILPPIDEQKYIAQYLDRECSKIDEAIADIQNQIDTLEEHKRSVIAEAVTKGLNPNVELKDSGIPWIGRIPSHWNVEKIKYNLRRHELRNPGDQTILSVYREYGVIPKDSRDDNHNVTSEDTSKYKYVKPGYFVINKMKAWQGSMGVSDFEGVVSPAYFIYVSQNKELFMKYIHHLFRTCYKDEWRRISGGIREGQWDLDPYRFENTLMVVPPYKEQKLIVEFLDRKNTEIEKIIADKKSELDILEEYKKSLIYEYVTGKKEVPNE